LVDIEIPSAIWVKKVHNLFKMAAIYVFIKNN